MNLYVLQSMKSARYLVCGGRHTDNLNSALLYREDEVSDVPAGYRPLAVELNGIDCVVVAKRHPVTGIAVYA